MVEKIMDFGYLQTRVQIPALKAAVPMFTYLLNGNYNIYPAVYAEDQITSSKGLP